jgi:hypothetical protein
MLESRRILIGGGVSVDSFNGRTGIVVPVQDDYDTGLIDNTSTVAGDDLNDALDALKGGLDAIGTVGNTIFVDGTYTGGSSDGSYQAPYTLIQDAFDNSTLNDTIDVANGVYAENLVVPHDLYINALGARVLSINRAAGELIGRLGKAKLHANGVIIYADSDDINNGDCLSFYNVVGQTGTERYAIGLVSSGAYDLGMGGIDLNLLVDLYGIGGTVRVTNTGASVNHLCIRNWSIQSIKDIQVETVGTFSTGVRCADNVPVTGELENVTCS